MNDPQKPNRRPWWWGCFSAHKLDPSRTGGLSGQRCTPSPARGPAGLSINQTSTQKRALSTPSSSTLFLLSCFVPLCCCARLPGRSVFQQTLFAQVSIHLMIAFVSLPPIDPESRPLESAASAAESMCSRDQWK